MESEAAMTWPDVAALFIIACLVAFVVCVIAWLFLRGWK